MPRICFDGLSQAAITHIVNGYCGQRNYQAKVADPENLFQMIDNPESREAFALRCIREDILDVGKKQAIWAGVELARAQYTTLAETTAQQLAATVTSSIQND